MARNGIVSATFAFLLCSTISCDMGGSRSPFEPPFSGTVQGLVTADETILPEVTVRLTGSQVRETRTSTTGGYSFSDLPAGVYQVAIEEFPEYVEFSATSKPAKVGRGSGAAEVDFRGSKKTDAGIAGTVMIGGTGAEGLTLSISGPESRSSSSDSQGGFEFKNLKRGVYTVIISGFDPTIHTFPATQQTAEARNSNLVEVHFSGTLVPYPPEAPTDLSASATGPSTIGLSWVDASTDETRFEVDRRIGPEGSWEMIGAPDPNSTSFEDTGLTPNTTYGYRLRACSEVGCSPISNLTEAQTEDVPPEAPSNLSASASGPFSMDLTWTDESDNETQFQIDRREASSETWEHVQTLAANVISFGDTELSPAATYHYRVKACNSMGCSAFCDEAEATTTQLPPEAPANLTVTATGPWATKLTWTDQGDNETGFRVERKEGAGAFSTLGEVSETKTSYSDTGLSPSMTYTYRVFAFNTGGDSPSSDEASATTWAEPLANLTISALYLTQSTQTLGGAVPLVAGRDGYLRVFATAGRANNLQPSVRVRFYLNGSLAQTEVISAPGSSVPTSVEQSSLGSSWNVSVPATLIQPGLTILADIDPANEVEEADEEDNFFPEDGAPLALDVVSTPAFEVTFVPIRQSVNGLVGDVTSGNAAQFMAVTKRMLPIAETHVVVHEEYVTDQPELERDNGNNSWTSILSEIRSLRTVEASTRYYYGVAKTAYSSGVAGMGYLGLPVAMGWDRLPSASAIAAHEWGHNWDRLHAPGCGAGNPDASFPYADGRIGTVGLDVGAKALRLPTTHYDFMSYCRPDWISDYSYEAILDYRQMYGGYNSPGAPEPALLVWGRVEGGRIILEPSFQVTTAPLLPARGGDYVLEGLGEDGSSFFSLSFDMTPIPDAPEGDGHFSYAIPLRSINWNDLAGLRVSGRGQNPAVMESRVGPEMAAMPEPDLTSRGGSVVEMTWDDTSYPMALVRNPNTGQVLSFARGGQVNLLVSTDEIEVSFSDGLRSTPRIRHSLR